MITGKKIPLQIPTSFIFDVFSEAYYFKNTSCPVWHTVCSYIKKKSIKEHRRCHSIRFVELRSLSNQLQNIKLMIIY